MPDTDIIPFGAAVVGDVLSALSIPGGNTFSALAFAALAKKRREAAEILIEEISSGRHGPVEFDAHDVDPLIEIILRFSKVVAEGAARENLVLLAQVIAGMKKHRALESDEFRKWSKVIEHLTRDVLLVVGFAYRLAKERPADRRDDFNGALRQAIKHAGYANDELEALLMSVGGSGLLSSASAWGGLAYEPTRWLLELGKLADVEGRAARQR
jgi:hypothetical protein